MLDNTVKVQKKFKLKLPCPAAEVQPQETSVPSQNLGSIQAVLLTLQI